MIPRKLLEKLLSWPATKCVLAFREVRLEHLGDYCDWAIQCMLEESSCDAFALVASYCGKEPIDSFDLMADLRLLLYELEVTEPEGAEAVQLFVLGSLERVASAPCGDLRMLQTLADLLESYPGISGSRQIVGLKYDYWDTDGEPCEDVLRRFQSEARRLVASYAVQLREEKGRWRIGLACCSMDARGTGNG